MKRMNETLLRAFKEEDTDTILNELLPLFYKHMKGVSPSMREEVFQELVLTCVQVVSKYDFQQTHQFL